MQLLLLLLHLLHQARLPDAERFETAERSGLLHGVAHERALWDQGPLGGNIWERRAVRSCDVLDYGRLLLVSGAGELKLRELAGV